MARKRIQIRIKQRTALMPRDHKKGTLLTVDEFKEAYPKYEDYTIDETWAFNTKNREIFQLVVNGKDVTNMSKKAKMKATRLTFGTRRVTLDDDGETAVCDNTRWDIGELRDWLEEVENAVDHKVDAESGNYRLGLSNTVTIGCCSGTVEQVRAIVDAAEDLAD